MTELLYSPKIKPEHLARKAIVYLRQSSEKQVRENKESQRLQLDLAVRMRALGWKEVEIVGTDLGSSARLVKKVVRSDKMRQNFIGKSQVRS
jgi:transketolase N-terminal domain/subunit